MLLISKLLKKKGSLWLRWSHHCIYLTNDHSNVPYIVPEHLNSPVYFRVVMSAIISMKNRSSIRVMFYLLHLYLFSDTGVQRDLRWCRICQTFQSTPAFKWGSCWMIISFLYNVLWIVICPFVIFHFTFVMSSFDLRLLVTPMVSSNYSHLSMWCSPSKKIDNVST